MKKNIVLKIISLFFISYQSYAMEDATPLHSAVKKGNKVLVEALLKKSSIDVNKRDNFGFTPLHVALIRGKLVDMRSISYKFDWAESKNPEEDLAIVRLLILHGADTTLEIDKGYAKIVPTENEVVQKALAARKEVALHSNIRYLSLHDAINDGDVKHVIQLLQHHSFDVDINERRSGEPVLHSAIKSGKKELVKVILSVPGVLINDANDQGLTPLQNALFWCGQGVTYALEVTLNKDKAENCLVMARDLILHGADEKLKIHNIICDIIPSEAEVVQKALAERKAVRLSLCAGLHPWLGANSPLKILDSNTVRYIVYLSGME